MEKKFLFYSGNHDYKVNRQSLLCILVTCIYACLSAFSYAESEFEESFLQKDKNGASVDIFIYQNAVMPGNKTIDIMVNDQFKDQMDVLFISTDNKKALPCLTREQVKTLAIKVELYGDSSVQSSQAGEQGQCFDILERIPSADMIFDNAHQMLKITVPQEAVDSQHFTMIPSQEWDHGVPSLRTSYSGYFYNSRTKGYSGSDGSSADQTSRSTYVNFESVGSLGAWRLYSWDSFYRNPGQGWESNHDQAYIARDIAFLRSNLQAGEIYTQTSQYMTGSVPLRGISLATNEKMSMDNQYRYAPMIRGVANTNARLFVRQRNNIIYSKTLTPGPFAIADLYSAQVGADLDVTVEESDGRVQYFRVPYTALPNMIRPGAFRYSLAAGKYRSQNSDTEKPFVLSGSMEYGFEYLTFNSSLLASEDYQSLSAGAAWNLGSIGAFSTDIIHARHNNTWDGDKTRDGSAIRFLYARFFDATSTSMQLLGYQYRSEEFLDFQEYLSRQSRRNIDGYHWGDSEWNRRKRNRLEMNINQNISEYGSLYLTLSQDRYYGSDRKSTSVSAGASTNIGTASVSLSLTRTQDHQYNDNQLSLSFNMPLGSLSERQSDYGSVSYGLTRDRNNKYSQSFGYNASAFDSMINYSANMQRDSRGEYSQSGSLGYNGSLANISAGIGHSNNYRQYSASMSGGVTLYSGGIILSPSLGNTVAIVDTPGASGIGVSGSSNARTDYFGHAMVTYLTPYRYNEINLDTSRTEGVELRESSRRIVPSEGAAVHLHFATRVGRRAIVSLKSTKSIPLGAIVYIENEEAGIVGNKGETYLSGLDARTDQKLKVIWGDLPNQQCDFTLPMATGEQLKPENWYHKVNVNCI